MKLGFIGLGHMGAGMASNLLKAGHEVTVYNRTVEKARTLAAQGAHIASIVAHACRGDAVFTMLSTDEAVETVVLGQEGIAANLRPGALHISSSTISLPLSERLHQEHTRRGQLYLSAPVFGRPEAAAARELIVVAAGEGSAQQAGKPLLEAIGKQVFMVGQEPQTANLIKLSGNFLTASVIESLGEALALAVKAGVDQRQYTQIVTSLFDAAAYRIYTPLIAQRRFEPPAFAAPLGYKDIRLLLAAAENLGVPMPVANVLRDRFLRLLAHAGDQLDWSAIGGLAAEDAAIRT